MTPEQERILLKVDMRLRRIETVLTGDPDFKVRGLVDKVDYHGKKIAEFEKDKIKVVAGATVISIIASFLASIIHKIFNQ